MRVKICGICRVDQGVAIAQEGATALGFICVPASPRYVTPEQLKTLVAALPASVDSIGVFANETPETIAQIVAFTGISGVQLHGDEDPEFCRTLRSLLDQGPQPVEIIKAFRIRNRQDLGAIAAYGSAVDSVLLDAYHPQILGGTGHTLDWEDLAQFRWHHPWFLAGGLRPDNVPIALETLAPDGIDLSSGVEIEPGNKDLGKVKTLFANLQRFLPPDPRKI